MNQYEELIAEVNELWGDACDSTLDAIADGMPMPVIHLLDELTDVLGDADRVTKELARLLREAP